MRTIRNLLFLLFAFGIHGAAVLDDFGAFPAYVITFSRETPEDADYPQLTAIENGIIFGVLNHIFTTPSRLKFFLERYIKRKNTLLENYNSVIQPIYERFRDFLKAPDSIECLQVYLSEKPDFKWLFDHFESNDATRDEFSRCRTIKDVSEFVIKYITLPTILDHVPIDKRSLFVNVAALKISPKSTETVLQKYVLGFISPSTILDYFKQKMQSEVQQDFKRRFLDQDYEEAIYLSRKFEADRDFFDHLQQESQHLITQLVKVAGLIRDHSCLVVFNEMFFGKAKTAGCTGTDYAPLAREKKAELERCFLELSRVSPQSIFYVNHLHETEKVLGREFSTILRVVDAAWKATPPPHPELFEAAGIPDIQKFLAAIQPDQQYSTFANETFIYTRESIVGKYRKATYKDEADELLKAGWLYLFGAGREETLMPDNPIQQFLSTETCFDLKLGIRRKFNNYPVDCKMHIITSNTLPFSLTDSAREVRENFSHFPPDGIPFVLHVDPHQQDLFVKIPPTKNFFFDKHQAAKTTSHDIYQGFHPAGIITHDAMMEVKFGIGKNVFTVKVFDMHAARKKLGFYS